MQTVLHFFTITKWQKQLLVITLLKPNQDKTFNHNSLKLQPTIHKGDAKLCISLRIKLSLVESWSSYNHQANNDNVGTKMFQLILNKEEYSISSKLEIKS